MSLFVGTTLLLWTCFLVSWGHDGLLFALLVPGFWAITYSATLIYFGFQDLCGKIRGSKWTFKHSGLVATFVSMLIVSNFLTILFTWSFCLIMGSIMWQIGEKVPRGFPRTAYLSMLFVLALPIANLANAFTSPLFTNSYWHSYLWTLTVSVCLFLIGLTLGPMGLVLRKLRIRR